VQTFCFNIGFTALHTYVREDEMGRWHLMMKGAFKALSMNSCDQRLQLQEYARNRARRCARTIHRN
jgi:hypothetical protein